MLLSVGAINYAQSIGDLVLSRALTKETAEKDKKFPWIADTSQISLWRISILATATSSPWALSMSNEFAEARTKTNHTRCA